MNITNNALSIKDMKDIINKLGWNDIFDVGLYSKLNFNNNKPKIILIQSDKCPLYGHWCMFYNNIFYDASGNKPLEIFDKYNLDKNKQDYNKLFYYFKKYNDIDYNDFDFQKSLNSQTCGHHCIVRYFYNDLDNEQYKKFIFLIKKTCGYNKFDDLIVDLCKLIINKNA